MTTVIKIGGSVLEPEPSEDLAQALARRALAGERLCLVHGGGKALTAMLSRLGIASRFHRGLRVTDRPTLDAAVMVLAGAVNTRLVAALNRALALKSGAAAGPRAVGLSGVDGVCLRACAGAPELGFVGEVTGGEPRLLETLLASGFIPVLASIAAAADGSPLNVNADAFAAACAVQLRADRLLFLTDVPGVRDGAGRTIAELDLEELETLSAGGAVSGGMLPKLASCRAALAGGVGEIAIAGATEWITGGAPAGTRLRNPCATAEVPR